MNKIEAIFCDMDGCAVKYPNEPWHSSWGALRLCLSEENKKLWDAAGCRYYGKQDKYGEWCECYAGLLKGISVKQAESFLVPIPYNPGFEEFFSNGFFKFEKKKILKGDIFKGILSGGINIPADKIKEEMGFDFALSNRLLAENGYFTGKIEINVDLYKKRELLLDCLLEHNIHPSRVCYIGDSDTDRGCLELAGFPVVINPKENLEEFAREKEIPIIHDFRQLNEIYN